MHGYLLINKRTIVTAALIVFIISTGGTFNATFNITDDAGRLTNYLLMWLSGSVITFTYYSTTKKSIILLDGLFKGTVSILFILLVTRWNGINQSDIAYLVKLLSLIMIPFISYFVVSLLSDYLIVRAIFYSLLATLIVSLLMYFIFPDISIMQFARGSGLSGLYAQKNSLGRQIATLILFSLFYLKYRGKVLPYLWILICFVSLLLTNSRSSFIIASLFLVFTLITRGLQLSKKMFHTTAVFAGLIILVMYASDTLFQYDGYTVHITGIELDLTGRLSIWRYLMDLVNNNYYFGIGFDGIWSGNSTLYLLDDIGWKLTDAHNGYLEVFVQLGLVGFAAYMVLVAKMLNYSWFHSYSTIKSHGQIFFPLAIYVLLINITSSHYLEVMSNVVFYLFWMLFSSMKVRELKSDKILNCHTNV